MPGFKYQHGDRPLEGYTIQRGVGRGGFGEVYYAVSDSGRQVALKAIQSHQDIELRGLGHCMNLKNPHLVTIFDVKYNGDGAPFVIMEYVSGPSLRDLIDDSPAGLGVAKAAFFLREIAKGLTYLHDCGIVHRDLKPHNIFYEDGYVKIGDYSLSKAISNTHHSGHTITVGTVHYMAPEIGQGNYDRGIDIYALGVMLYEMLTGQAPYLGSSPGEVLMKHMSAEPDLTDIEEPFATAIRKAMAKDPAQRYQTVQEMVEAVFGTEHIRNSVSSFQPNSLSQVAGKAARDVDPGNAKSGGGHGGDMGDELAHRINAGVNRIVDSVSHAAERASHAAERVSRRHGHQRPRHGRANMGPASDQLDDPLTWSQRCNLAMLTAAAVSLGTGLFSGHLAIAVIVFLLIICTSWGIVKATRAVGTKLRGEVPITNLAVGSIASICAMAVWAPVLALSLTGRDIAWIGAGAMLPALFILDWVAATRPTRRERISLWHALGAAFLGFVAATVFGGPTGMVIGALAGISMTVQTLSPWIGKKRSSQTQKPVPQPAANVDGEAKQSHDRAPQPDAAQQPTPRRQLDTWCRPTCAHLHCC